MREKKEYVRGMKHVLTMSQREKRKYEIQVLGKRFVVHPNVFSPKYYGETTFFARSLPVRRNEELLEIGCGTGVISVVSILKGAARVVATDVNRDAVKNAEENVRLHSMENLISVREGDLYACLSDDEEFDTIFWALPVAHIQKPIETLTMLERAIFDPDYEALERFIKGSRSFLKADGRVIVGTSPTLGHIGKVRESVCKHRFRMQLLEETTTTESRRPVPAAWPITWQLYELVPLD